MTDKLEGLVIRAVPIRYCSKCNGTREMDSRIVIHHIQKLRERHWLCRSCGWVAEVEAFRL